MTIGENQHKFRDAHISHLVLRMSTLLWLTSLAAAIAAVRLAFLIRSALSDWAVCQSWNWMIAGLLTLVFQAFLSLPPMNMSRAVVSAATYFSATMLLTPLVTTLGARRPGISAWHWFVVLPMVAVLQWPALSQLSGSHWRSPLDLSGPAVMGVVVVLIMSAGTMLGTSSAGFALLYSSGILLLLAPSTSLGATSLGAAESSVAAGGAMLILAALAVARRNLERRYAQLRAAPTRMERLSVDWELFGSLYGLAWTRRVQDRVNQFASDEKWTVRLTATGLQRLDGGQPTDADVQVSMNALIWVLARFADKTWLKTALNPRNQNSPANRLN